MKLLISIIFLYQMIDIAYAGSLANGEWTPSKCGDKPVAPVVDDQSVDSFNKSVKAINDWQQQAKIYYGCLVSEANADNALIAEKANREQAGYKQDFTVISTAMDAARKKLEGK